MPDDVPGLSEIIAGVSERMDWEDLLVAFILISTGTGYAFVNDYFLWWSLPIILSVVIASTQAAEWYYYDYRESLLLEKAERIAQGEDLDMESSSNTGPSISDPSTIAILITIFAWGEFLNYFLKPMMGGNMMLVVLYGGIIVIVIGWGKYLDWKETG